MPSIRESAHDPAKPHLRAPGEKPDCQTRTQRQADGGGRQQRYSVPTQQQAPVLVGVENTDEVSARLTVHLSDSGNGEWRIEERLVVLPKEQWPQPGHDVIREVLAVFGDSEGQVTILQPPQGCHGRPVKVGLEWSPRVHARHPTQRYRSSGGMGKKPAAGPGKVRIMVASRRRS